MRIIYIVFIALLVLFSGSSYTYATSGKLIPPNISSVLTENEKKMKLIERKKRANRTQTGVTQTALSYKTILTGRATTLSRYDTVELWVQELKLYEGARIESILSLKDYDQNSGEPLFEKKRISDVLSSLRKTPFSIINGQFFDPRKEVTPLSFGVKINGVVQTAGADNRDESKNILIIEDHQARIVPYSWEALRDAPGYLAMVNLTLDKPHYRDQSIGRTYICLKTPTVDNTSNTLIIFTALSMSEPLLEGELPRWGCTRSGTTKLDASGSTRLWIRSHQCRKRSNPNSCQSEYIYGKSHKGDPDYRKIPHYIAIWDR